MLASRIFGPLVFGLLLIFGVEYAASYNGSWFVIARKASRQRYFLPMNMSSCMVQLILNADNSSIDFTEYHTKNETCESSFGTMSPHKNGYMLQMNKTVEEGLVEKVFLRPIYHGYSGDNNEEMNMVLYGCLDGNDDGGCIVGDELVLIMSNSRHPQTLQLFKSAKIIEDEACIDILHFNALDTYNECGDDAVDEDQKLRHAKIDEDNEFVDVECRVENIRPAPNNIDTFFDEPRVLTVVAYIDPMLFGEQIAHISCRYRTKTAAVCEWIRQDTCFKTNLTQSLADNHLTIRSTIQKTNGSEMAIDWSGFVLWENGDEYISMHCGVVGDDGACDSVRVYVWSDEDHMDQPTINTIYRVLQSVCVDPTDLIFLNTFHECIIPAPTANPIQCSSPNGWSPITLSMLHGVWYIAADLNADPKLFLQSAVIDMKARENSTQAILDITYYVQKESDGLCVGPGNAEAILTTNGELHVDAEYAYSIVPGYKSTIKLKFQILYLDNQRAVLYWCFKRNSTGSCTQHDVTFMIRSRHFSHNDLSMILPYLDKVCIEKNDLRWYDLHSQCGLEISSTTILRRDLITLSHYHVLDILTNVQEPKCRYDEVRGVRADLHSLERAGSWFLMSRMDEMSMDTYAMIGRVFVVTNTTAVLRLIQSAALPGEHRECFTRVFTIRQRHNESDYWYELHFESTTKNSTFMIFRFLFFNRNVGVIYSCLRNAVDGRCDEKAIYVISRHESIDHPELTVLEKVAKSVCIEPILLYHVAAHDECIIEPSRLKPPACSSIVAATSNADWHELSLQQIEATYGRILYQAVASSNIRQQPPFGIQFDGAVFQKINEQESGCLSSPIASIRFSSRNRNLVQLDDLVVLLHPAGVRSDLLLKEAQLSGVLPCLTMMPPPAATNCTLLAPPRCKLQFDAEPIADDSSSSSILGEWFLYSSDPMFVLNWRCTFAEGDEAFRYALECHSESWVGECERPTRGHLAIDKTTGAFNITMEASEASIRTPEAELFRHGNITISPERIILINDHHLVGRAYSLWLRKPDAWNEKVRVNVNEYCIWPLESQIRHTAMLC
ncbi:unnamed protein product [Caenorhabditis bovis]|uniref:Uncharacterized protein n=1 Tax=Caenorhabditis bovis TaxID=2654633 RepID=A0A8S1F3T4_9PELO|nr:unnamed protein product [Caenorhabditis bovis]